MADTTTGAMSAFEAMAASGAASKATYTGAGATFAAGVSGNDWMALIGVVIALAGFVVNWHYKRKHFVLAEREANARLAERGMYDQG